MMAELALYKDLRQSETEQQNITLKYNNDELFMSYSRYLPAW